MIAVEGEAAVGVVVGRVGQFALAFRGEIHAKADRVAAFDPCVRALKRNTEGIIMEKPLLDDA